MTMDTKLALEMVKKTHKPHRLCKLVDGTLWEFITYPWEEGGRIWVSIRRPGDPTTIRMVEAFSACPEHQDCLCAVAGEFYFQPKDRPNA